MTNEIKEKEAERDKLLDELNEHKVLAALYKSKLLNIKVGSKKDQVQEPVAIADLNDSKFPRSTPYNTAPIRLFKLISEDGNIYQVTDAYEQTLDENGNVCNITPVFYSDIWWLDQDLAKKHWIDGTRCNGYLVSLDRSVDKTLWRSGEHAISNYKNIIDKVKSDLSAQYHKENNICNNIELQIEVLSDSIQVLEEKVSVDAIKEKIGELKDSPKLWGNTEILATDKFVRCRNLSGGCPETALSPCHTAFSLESDWCGTFRKVYKSTPDIAIINRLGFKQFICLNSSCQFRNKCKLAGIDILRWEFGTYFDRVVGRVNTYRDYQSFIGGEHNPAHQYRVIEAMEDAENKQNSTGAESGLSYDITSTDEFQYQHI